MEPPRFSAGELHILRTTASILARRGVSFEEATRGTLDEPLRLHRDLTQPFQFQAATHDTHSSVGLYPQLGLSYTPHMPSAPFGIIDGFVAQREIVELGKSPKTSGLAYTDLPRTRNLSSAIKFRGIYSLEFPYTRSFLYFGHKPFRLSRT
jgi:hypothetical protein